MQQKSAAAWAAWSRNAAQLAARALVLLLVCSMGVASAQDEHVLLRMLHSGKDFRVRAQAAFALGRRLDPAFAPALEGALRDKHAVVRAAAASALGRIGEPRSLPPLRAATKDRVRSVIEQAETAIAAIEKAHPQPVVVQALPAKPATPQALRALAKARYALVIGKLSNESGFGGSELAGVLGESLQRELSSLRTVAVLDERDTGLIEAAVARSLPVLRIEGNVRQTQREIVDEQVSVHCEISLIVMDQSERNMRTVLKGGATGLEPSMGPLAAIEKRLARKAVDGAVRSALRNASSAIEKAAAVTVVKRGETATASLGAR